MAGRADRLARARAAKPAAPISCASIAPREGWPILGDPIYGARADVPLQLLARKIVVPLAKSGPPIEVQAPVPAHMREALAACGWTEEARVATAGA